MCKISWNISLFSPTIHSFSAALSGVKVDVFDNVSKEGDYFISLLTPETVDIIVQESRAENRSRTIYFLFTYK